MVLMTGPKGRRSTMVAATDCSDQALPVPEAAGGLAFVLGRELCVVHNVDAAASQLAARLRMPLSGHLADCVAMRSREWLEQATGLRNIVVSRHNDNARGILSVVDDWQADLLVMGAKRPEQVLGGTAAAVLGGAHTSVLFVPFPTELPQKTSRGLRVA